MDGVGLHQVGSGENGVPAQIRLRWGGASQGHRDVGLAREQRLGIRLREHCGRRDP